VRSKDRTLRGGLYIADDEDLATDFRHAQEILERYNRSAFAEQDLRDQLLRELLGDCGEGVHIRPPFHLEYGPA
jgi:maltose O-acetyltransferase